MPSGRQLLRFFALRVTAEPEIPGAVIPRSIFTHGVIPGWSHTQAQGISSPGVDDGPPHGARDHGGLQWSTMWDWMCR